MFPIKNLVVKLKPLDGESIGVELIGYSMAQFDTLYVNQQELFKVRSDKRNINTGKLEISD